MATALDVANYFLSRVDRESGDLITQLKLYKLVYYAQAWSLVLRQKALYSSEIQAWEHGPVPIELYPLFQGYAGNPIPEPSPRVSPQEVFEEKEEQVLDLVWQSYGELTASKLRALTHAEEPWRRARKGLSDGAWCNNRIPEDDMAAYYSRLANSGDIQFDIPRIAVSLDRNFRVETDECRLSGSISDLMDGDLSSDFIDRVKIVAAKIQESDKQSNYPEGLAAYLASYTD